MATEYSPLVRDVQKYSKQNIPLLKKYHRTFKDVLFALYKMYCFSYSKEKWII